MCLCNHVPKLPNLTELLFSPKESYSQHGCRAALLQEACTRVQALCLCNNVPKLQNLIGFRCSPKQGFIQLGLQSSPTARGMHKGSGPVPMQPCAKAAESHRVALQSQRKLFLVAGQPYCKKHAQGFRPCACATMCQSCRIS